MALSELLAATVERAHDPKRATGHSLDFDTKIAAPILNGGKLAFLEGRLGAPYPDFLKVLYTQIGNGDFGPGYGLMSAEEALADAVYWNRIQIKRPSLDFLPFINWGCTIRSVVELKSGRVGIVDIDSDGEDSNFPSAWWDYESIEAFWRAWISGEKLIVPWDHEDE